MTYLDWPTDVPSITTHNGEHTYLEIPHTTLPNDIPPVTPGMLIEHHYRGVVTTWRVSLVTDAMIYCEPINEHDRS